MVLAASTYPVAMRILDSLSTQLSSKLKWKIKMKYRHSRSQTVDLINLSRDQGLLSDSD
jgi:hypothetical protein